MVLAVIFGIAVIIAFVNGYRKGLVRTIAQLGGYVFLTIIATMLAHPVGQLVTKLLTSASAAYRPTVPTFVLDKGVQFLASGISFSLIFFIGGIIVHNLLKSLKFIQKIPVVGGINAIIGGTVSALIIYVIGFFILSMLSVMNITWVHQQFVAAPILNNILDNTPIISNQIYHWWLNERAR